MDYGYWALFGAVAVIVIARLSFMWSGGKRARKTWDRAMAAFQAGEYEAAEEQLQRLVRKQPLWTPARRMLARVQIERQKFVEAEEQLLAATQFEPRNGEAYADLGWFLAVCTDRRDEALAAFRKALEHAPGLREHLAAAHSLQTVQQEDARFRELLSSAKGAGD